MSEDPIRVPGSPMEQTEARAQPGVHEHWGEHPGCRKWGSFGHAGRSRGEWFCGEHRPQETKGGA